MKLTLRLLILLAWVAFGPPQAAQAQCNSQYTGTGTGATTTGAAAGMYGQYYPGTFHTQAGFNEANPVTFFSGLASSVQRVDATVNYADAGFGNVNGNGTGVPVNFSARYKGSVTLTTGAPYTFYLTSDDASYMFLGREATVASPTPNNAFIKNGGNHGNVEVTNTISVPNTGLYDVQILLGQGGGGVSIKLEYSGGPANLARQVVPSSALCAGPSNRVYTGSLAPSTNNVTNATLPGNGGTTTLNPNLSGFDLDGTVASYLITTLPAQGTLKNGATAVTANTSIPVASLGNLTYTTVNGQTTAVSFQYAAVDNSGVQGNTATYTIPVQSNSADLGTTLASPATAAQGSLIFYTATVTNNGPATATGITTNINLPAGLTGVSLSNSGTYNATTGVATFPGYDLGSGGTVSRNIAFSMTAGTVNATASSTASAATTDPNSNNNVGSAFTNPTQVADMSVAINGPSRVLTNQAVVYSVVPTNVGPSTATGIVLTAQLATGLVNVVASGPNGAGSYVPGTGVVTWPPISSMVNGASLVHTVQFNSPATSGGIISASAAATSSTANGDPVAGNNDGSADQSKITTAVVDLAATLLCVIPGQNGNVNLASNFNTYFPGVGTAGVGTGNPSSLVLGAASAAGATTPIVAGDLVLIMQMQGADINAADTDAYGDGLTGNNDASGIINTAGANAASFTAGVYEYAIAGAGTNITTAGGTLTLTQALGYTYSTAAATAATGQRRFQIIRVPRYANATLPATGGPVTGPAWNGSTGGVMALDVNGVLDFNGNTLSMAGKGFRGGAGQQLGGDGSIAYGAYRHSTAATTSANKGEGIAGTSRYLNNNGVLLDNGADGYSNGDRGRGAPGNAGGGGTDGRPAANDQNSGGGGGSNAGRGGVGGNGWDSNSPTGGYGGAGFTQATASRIIMGGGAGAGTTNNATGTPGGGFASSGAAGGGVIIIRATDVSTNAGTIDVSGSSMTYVPDNDASGGGGAGGSVVALINASDNRAGVLQNITLLAKGGTGGSNTGGGSPHGPGGGGAGGVSFTSSPTSSSSSLIPGANGSTLGFLTYGSGVASASLGQGLSNITRANVPNIVVGCPADVQTTVVNSTGGSNAAAPGSTVTFTVTTLNNGTNGTANNVQTSLLIAPNLPFITVNGAVGTPIGSTASFSYPDGSTYNSNTGIVTFPAASTLGVGAQLVNTVSFAMPVQTVRGQATANSDFDLDPRLANNDGTLPQANTFVAAINSIAGRVFDDVNYGGGSGRSYAAANAAAVATGFPDGKVGSPNTRVELYTYGTNGTDGNFVSATTTGPDGAYGFSSVPTNADYTVRVVNSTVKSLRNPTASTALAVQTFRRTTVGALPTGTTSSVVTDDVDRVGGENPALVDGSQSAVQLTLLGLNPSGGDNTAFVDAVEIVSVSTGAVVATALNNGSFETPVVTAANQTGPGYLYSPNGGTWAFNGTTGLVANGGGFGNANAPAGNQGAFIQAFGSISQPLTLLAGTYFVRFQTAQRPGNAQSISVQINGTQISSIQPAGTAYQSYSSPNFSVGALNTAVIPQSIATLHLGATLVAGVDFGFNFDLVVNKNGAGQGSLRQFLTNANVLPNSNLDQAASSNGGNDPAAGIETSIFMIPDGSTHAGMRSGTTNQLTAVGSGSTAGKAAIIDPGTATNGALPALTDANTSIDGTTQGLNVANTNNVTLGAGGTGGTATKVGTAGTTLAQLNSPEVQLVGTPGAANSDYGLTLSATNLTVQGLAIYGFGNTGAAGTGNATGANVYVTGGATTGILIQNNVIGTSANAFPTDGTDPLSAATRSTGHGILLANLSSGISATASILNNLIGFNGLSGIEDLANATSNSVLIQGNEIRRNGALSTSAAGVHFGTAGGTLQANLVTGNRGTGVDFGGTAGAVLATGNTVSSNGGGGTFSGVRAFGQGNTVSGNVIAGNTGDGVLVLAGTNAANVAGSTVISQNAISANTLLGIDLLTAGDSETAGTVTVNDLSDVDGGKNGSSALGGNGLLNFPVIVQARIQGTNLLVTGYARPGVKLEFFSVGGTASVPTPDASGFGEGPVYLATATEGSGSDTNAGSGAYSGPINGLNQGADNTNYFTFSIALSSLPAGVTLATGNVIVATATRSTVGTSEFSGKVTVGSGPLPVELTEFTAQAVQNKDAALAWRTATEKNNDHFDVERSLNGTDYLKIGQVAGQGTKTSPTDYALTDAGVSRLATGVVYYRLKQVDADGTATYSPVRTVAFAKVANPAIALFPNPATAATQLDLTDLPAGAYQVSVLDATGRTVLRRVLLAGLAHPLDLSACASGTYLVLVRGQNGGPASVFTKRLVKE